jgi:PKD repeat protein
VPRSPLPLLILVLLPLMVPASGSHHAAAMAFAPTAFHPLAAFTYNPCVMCAVAGDAVFFYANVTYPISTIKSFTWDFGDGTANMTTTNSAITHVFSNTLPGKWTVTLTVQDGTGQMDSISQQVLFNVLPRFVYVPVYPMVGEPVAFNASSTIIYQSPPTALGYSWSFGDGSFASGQVVKHAFSTPGPYRVIMTVATNAGNAQVSKTVVVVPFTSGAELVTNMRFDDTNVTLYGTFEVNQTSMTITGTVTVTAANATTGDVVYSKSFNITISYASGATPRFVIVIPTSPVWLSSSCSIDKSTGQANCFVSRDPDVTRDGRVDIIDFGILSFNYGSRIDSPGYDPTLDLAGDGVIGIVDVGIVAANYGVALYS